MINNYVVLTPDGKIGRGNSLEDALRRISYDLRTLIRNKMAKGEAYLSTYTTRQVSLFKGGNVHTQRRAGIYEVAHISEALGGKVICDVFRAESMQTLTIIPAINPKPVPHPIPKPAGPEIQPTEPEHAIPHRPKSKRKQLAEPPKRKVRSMQQKPSRRKTKGPIRRKH